MAYIPNIPQPGDQLSVSQGEILGNFIILGSVFNDVNNFAIKFPALLAAPTPANGINQMYSRLSPLTGNDELYIGFEADRLTLPSKQIPFAASGTGNGGTPAHDYYWSYLPSGLLLKWGKLPPNFSGGTMPATIVFPTGAGIPAFATLFNIVGQWTESVSGNENIEPAIINTALTNTTKFNLTSTQNLFTDNGYWYLAMGTTNAV